MSIFGWLQSMRGQDDPLGDLIGKFGNMVVNVRHSFDLATDAYLMGADAEMVYRDVVETDEKINEIHSEIRRGLVIHASLRGPGEVPFSLVMISVAKDAELAGDYAKHIARLALAYPKKAGDPFHASLLSLKSQISDVLAETRELYESEDTEKAAAFVDRVEAIRSECVLMTREILASHEERLIVPADPAATVLCYRYYRRILSHSLNIVTSVVLPLDYLDYYDEGRDTRSPLPEKKRDKKKRKKDKKAKRDKKKDRRT